MITVYSKNNCMQCKMVKKWLDEHSVAFNEINIEEQPEYVQTVLDMGYRAAPVVTNGTVSFSGFRPSELAKLVEV
ncbi:glutaredoxin-like protein NrdH [Lactococcus nasutitermitis]|uniref:Glutaredoxin-like protein NrdH n=1 Tax=Lactococcus nasutitermitis TaxID=1652957 RepID=A0ABV9JEK1_9LACT|nr:glutaredoxin-like protein NrdH [Lactococcus nasutitermitis]